MVHCYAFGPKHDLVADPEAWGPRREVCEEVSRLLGARVSVDGDGEADGELEKDGVEGSGDGKEPGVVGGKEGGKRKTETEVWDVRDVAPNKRQYCASFRIPRSVAFAARIPREAKQEDAADTNGNGGHAAPMVAE